jgi:hypothetical protein
MDSLPSEKPSFGVELFLKLLVIAVGIFLGLVFASILGFLTGWIPFEC